MLRPKGKEKFVKVWLRVSTLCGKARRTSQDTATTRTVSLLSFFFIVGTPFRVHEVVIQITSSVRYAWSWIMDDPVRAHQNF